MLLRWLIPAVTALVLVGQSVAAWAAAGVIGDAECCCPSPDRCKCHGDEPAGAPELRRCNGDAERVAPAPIVAVPPAAPVIAREIAACHLAPPALPSSPARRSEPPEKPPF